MGASVVFVVIGFLGIVLAVAMVANFVAASIRLAARQPRSPRPCSSASASSRSASNETVDPQLHGPPASGTSNTAQIDARCPEGVNTLGTANVDLDEPLGLPREASRRLMWP